MFLFSLSTELGKTVNELENTMDVPQLMEYVAYYQLRDEKTKKTLTDKINLEKPAEERGKSIIALLQTVAKKKGAKK